MGSGLVQCGWWSELVQEGLMTEEDSLLKDSLLRLCQDFLKIANTGPGLQSTSTTSVSAAELVVFGVQCGVVCAMMAAVLLFLWLSSTTCTCSSAICTK
ncbi:hypothetical protein AOLI_G00076030 [Acnodon oligacanthus]